MSDNNFVGGFYFKEPHEKAPDFVKGKIQIKLSDFAAYLRELKGNEPDVEWLSVDLKQAKSGKYYAERDTWKPTGDASPARAPITDDVPF